MAVNYEVDYNDKRLTDLEARAEATQNEQGAVYDEVMANTDKAYNDAINTVGVRDQNGKWNEGSMAAIQSQLANENTDFAIEKIEQQKEQAHKDYIKEQSGAYTDWQKQSNPYGVNAEKMAAAGMTGTGYSESAQVSLYNAYQNRVAVARESYQQAVMNYNNAITEARLNNNAVLAEIALSTLQSQLELSLEGLQRKNELLLGKAQNKWEVEKTYHTYYQDTLDQILRQKELERQKALLQIAPDEHPESDGQVEVQIGGETVPLESVTTTTSTGKVESDVNKPVTDTITTDYFSGQLPAGTENDGEKFGTFKNGYQPKGITGHGEVKRTGDTITFNTTTLKGEKRTVEQNIWKTPDGALWYWEGRDMRYVPYYQSLAPALQSRLG